MQNLFNQRPGFGSLFLKICLLALLALTSLPAAQANAGITPSDHNDIVVSIIANVPFVQEPTPDQVFFGEFTLHRTGPTDHSLRVQLKYSGTATWGQDYRPLTNIVVFPAGTSHVSWLVMPSPDALVESNETVVAELLPAPFGSTPYVINPEKPRATVVIRDQTTPPPQTNLVVSITASVPFAQEPTPDQVSFGEFTLHRTGPTDHSLRVQLRYSGTATWGQDYRPLTNIVVFPAGTSHVGWLVMPSPDALVEGNETVVAELLPAPFGSTPYVINPEKPRATVVIRDQTTPSPQTNVVSVIATVPIAQEPTTNQVSLGEFTFYRVGPTNQTLHLFLRYSGTASPGLDYRTLTNIVFIPAGHSQVRWAVTPRLDTLLEEDESVIVEIFPPPEGANPYLIDHSRHSATVIIRDALASQNRFPHAGFVQPANGTVFNHDDYIEIIVHGFDPDGWVQKLELFADNEIVAVTGMDRFSNTNRLTYRWSNASVGQHRLSARATDNLNQVGPLTNITIFVRQPDPNLRQLPDTYVPGRPFRVDLRVNPPRTSRAYALEDRPPSGWRVSDINFEGRFDPITGKVKFGPFTDTTPRTLSYFVTPPQTAGGRHRFLGHVSIDGSGYVIAGDQFIDQVPIRHPADVTPADFKLVLSEVTAYAAAWKSATNDIPLSFVTRAGFLWKHGEAYRFVSDAGAPPSVWVPEHGISSKIHSASIPDVLRSGPASLQPGRPAEFQISIAPPPGSAAVAIEEKIPVGWTVAEINEEGLFDPSSSTIRWGVFYDSSSRTLRYTLTPPSHRLELGSLQGTVSVDGAQHPIRGHEDLVSVDHRTQPRLESCQRGKDGVRLKFTGAPGQIAVLQRSTDLLDWEDLITLFLPDGNLDYLDPTGADNSQSYYRLQVR